MESCFPPLAALSLRGNSSSKKQKHRYSTGVDLNDDKLRYDDQKQQQQQQQQPHQPTQPQHRNNSEFMPKLEVLQDLDLYYIRQIASSLKVKFYLLYHLLFFI